MGCNMESYLRIGVGDSSEAIERAGRGEGGRPQPWRQAGFLGAIVLSLVAIAALGPGDPSWRPLNQDTPAAAHLHRMDEALARNDLQVARREWNEAYVAALRLGDWRGMIDVGEGHLRLGGRTGSRGEAAITARGIFQIAFHRAEREGSLDGVLRAAEAFADRGEVALADLALGAANGLAGGHPAAQVRARMDALHVRLASRTRSQGIL
jgi:hypothetical protein